MSVRRVVPLPSTASEPADATARLAVLARVADQLTSSLDVTDHLATLPRLLVPYLGDWVIVSVTDDDGDTVDVGSWHVDPARRADVERYSGLRADASDAETLGARVIRTGESVVVDDGVSERTRRGMRPGVARDLLLSLDPEAVALLPMLARGRTVGLVSVFAPAPFTEGQLAVAHDVAARAALAIDNARAYARADAAREQAERSARRLSLMVAVGEAVAGTDDPDEAMGQLARTVVPGLADWSTAVVLDDDGAMRDVGWAHRDPSRSDEVAVYAVERATAMTPGSPLATALRTGAVVHVDVVAPGLIADALGETPAAALLRDLAPTGGLCIPLVSRGRAFGALTLVTTARRGPFSENDVSTAVEVIRRATPIVDSARSAREVQRLAASMQRSLLTVGATPPWLSRGYRYLPADRSRQVGGDWYDVFGLPDGSAVVAIGDVMGHDIAAIAAMAQLRTLMRASAWGRQQSPAEVLAATDAASQGLGPASFATSVVAELEPPRPDGSVLLRFSNAGHLPPAVLGPDGVVRYLRRDDVDVPLGVAPDRPRHDHVEVLAPGSVLVLFTDGVVERRDRGLEEGLEEVAAVLAPLVDADLDTLLGALVSLPQAGGQTDDIAAIAVRIDTRPVAAGPPPAPVADGRSVLLPSGPTAPAVARHHVTRATAHLPAEVTEDARVLVSELAGNAVRHGRPPLDLRIETDDRSVRVGVRDAGPTFVRRGTALPSDDRTSGRGLIIVESLAATWEIEPTVPGPGKTVWFRLDA